jgi:pimeloyl-ACP methyl ester carboxylesterase
VTALGGDVISVLNALGTEDPLVIGHDWGATAVTAVSRLDPSLVGETVVIAVPPNFVEALETSPRQVMRSWYMSFFQIPGLAEETLRSDDFALLERLWRGWSPNWEIPEERLESVKETFREGETVEASLLYYRAFFDDVMSQPDALRVRGVEAPTLVVAGRNDGCVSSAIFEDSGECYEGRFELEVISGAGHFVHAEKPDVVADRILDFTG